MPLPSAQTTSHGTTISWRLRYSLRSALKTRTGRYVPMSLTRRLQLYEHRLHASDSRLAISLGVRPQVGACIIDPALRRIVGIGYNGFPIGCGDDDLPWAREGPSSLETKYAYVCHAEMNVRHAPIGGTWGKRARESRLGSTCTGPCTQTPGCPRRWGVAHHVCHLVCRRL